MNIATASMPFLKAGMGAFKMLKGVAKGKLYRFRHLDEVCNCFVAGTLVTVAAEGDPATGVGDGDSSRLVGASQADWANDSAAAESAGLRSEEERPPGSIVEMARDTSWGAADREQPLPGADLLSRPIECVEVGDVVLARSERDSVSEPRPGRVTAVFRAVAPAILWLGLSSGETLGTTPGHEVWTVEHGWTSAAYVRPGDTFVDPFGAPVTIESAILDEHPTPVYNLEVDGTFTYYAGGVWVHNNSACPAQLDIWRGRHGAAPHVDLGQDVMRKLIDDGIPADKIRWNQALVSPHGKHWPDIRPDIQYIEDGKVHIVEIVNTSAPANGRREEIARRLGDAFGTYDVKWVED